MAWVVDVDFKNKKDEIEFNKRSCNFGTFNITGRGFTFKTKKMAKKEERRFLKECKLYGLKVAAKVCSISLANHTGDKP